MSAPDTNTKKQAKRHKPSLLAISLAVIVGSLLLIWMLTRVMVTGEDTADQAAPTLIEEEAPPAQIEDTTGIPAEGAPTDLGPDGEPQVIDDTTAAPPQ
ncbi:hypothetical protein [Natronohydrobacter thiooxidans]|jgi:hypothetical protein|uniref:hypothetical protein n=1 Tax=Natronohydrobacter thiooxidans TaxID=87172 RepID=UPI0008FF1FBD|nr:hypothetical protein [Natronohydrobacter thiooxidans]